jgi:signal transduction histidine kinase
MAADEPRRRSGRRMALGELLALIAVGPVLILIASVVVGIVTLSNAANQRRVLLDKVEPADAAALNLATAMVDQETGIRGYELTGDRRFLAPYTLGRHIETTEIAFLRSDGLHGTAPLLATVVTRIDTWETLSAVPAIHQRLAAGPVRNGTSLDATIAGKARFDAIRAALTPLQAAIQRLVRSAQVALEHSASVTRITFATIAVVLALVVFVVAVAVLRLVNRPILRLKAATRRVADGDLDHSVLIDAPRDIEQLAADVEGMRLRLLRELDSANAARAQLAEAAAELERSNSELEQFAYVASHDLQEPLRKVTSFCQLLQDRYGGRLDDKADEYIYYAVDGAQRMQRLISDLLTFSRVGRAPGERQLVDLGVVARAAAADLEEPEAEREADVEIGPMPTLAVETSLMRAVFQNLIGNSIKFRGEARPQVSLTAQLDGDFWVISCTDNGIGIEPQYGERIFDVFQRLHPRDTYPGTGIGLALCRKIVEYHGGRIWLDTSVRQGTRISFTLPVAPEPADEPVEGAAPAAAGVPAGGARP